MGNIIVVNNSKFIKTKNGDHKMLSECFYAHEDRDINKGTTKEEDAETLGGKFWEKFWDLWRSADDPKFKKILQKYHFQPCKRLVQSSNGKSYQKWSLQINHWLDVPEIITPEEAEKKRKEEFEKCFGEVYEIITRHYPEVVDYKPPKKVRTQYNIY